MTATYPDEFLSVRVDHLNLDPGFLALCAGYEAHKWRADRLADHLFQWLPFAALSQENQFSFAAHNFVEMLRLAAAHIYHTKKTQSRGELGELILHLACIQFFKTIPVMCKLVLKSSSNETVKGFDGIHLLPIEDDFEIWLGESKFYDDPKRAIKDAVSSVKQHLLPAFLTAEKAMVFGHVDKSLPHREALLKLFKSTSSSDELIKKAVFPVLIAYNSEATKNHNALTPEYTRALDTEVQSLIKYFGSQAAGISITFRIIFVPMNNKAAVIASFDNKLAPFL